MEKNKKQALILSIVAVVTLIALVVGATYAYFQAQGGTGSSTEVKVTTYTTDMLTFTTGSAISLYADQSSFGQEKGSLSGETFAKATLVANNKTNEATDNYYVYFNIENNTFKYTLGEDKPELILTITGPDGNEVTEISGLTHKVVQDRENKSISGFDVTTTNGLITIANKKTITATTDAKEEQYTLKLSFVNYEGDQTANATSSLSAKVMIQKEKIVQTVANICKNGQSLSSCIAAMDGIDETLYHHTATLTNGAGDNSYRYAGASSAVNNYVCFGSTQSPCPADNLYRIIGVFDNKVGENQTEQRVKLIKSDYATSASLGTDGEYGGQYIYGDSEYKGNNYANIASYYWNRDRGNLTMLDNYYQSSFISLKTISTNNSYGNAWDISLLNKTNLNTNFINNIGSEWANKIATTTWKVGGIANFNSYQDVPSVVYQNEIVNPSTTYDAETEYTAKIGLMYVSDYVFAASPNAWALIMNYYYTTISTNWMYMGLVEWTITRDANNSADVFSLNNYGSATNDPVESGKYAVRPAFYLSSSVTYVEGDGTQNSPIRIN